MALRKLPYTEYEICGAYKNRPKGKGKGAETIRIQAELNACSTDEIKLVLLKNGINVEGQKSKWLLDRCRDEGISPDGRIVECDTESDEDGVVNTAPIEPGIEPDIPVPESITEKRYTYSMKIPTRAVINAVKVKHDLIQEEIASEEEAISILHDQIAQKKNYIKELNAESDDLYDFYEANKKYLEDANDKC